MDIDNGFLEASDEHSAKVWFVQNKPAGYKLRKVQGFVHGFKVIFGEATKNLQDLRIKFNNFNNEKSSKKI